MKKLYILYDNECELCRRSRLWLDRQPAYVRLVFIPFQSPEAECRFPGLRELRPEKEIVVVSDAGAVCQGGAAWVMCLWALREYREWSLRLAPPALLSLARRLCAVVSENRHRISHWLKKAANHEELRRKLDLFPAAQCKEGGQCRTY